MTFAAPHLDGRSALFLDFDGTLVDIAATPERVIVEPALVDTLGRLHHRLEGALALVSGRPIEAIDRWLAPLVLPVAGIHGAERRRADGHIERLAAAPLEAVAELAEQLAALHPGLRVERKGLAVALHYRQAPEFEATCLAAMSDAVTREPSLHLLRGKKVVEVLPSGVSKGHAIEAFLRESPFAGRRPLFIGDDITDEDGFAAVQRVGGVSIKVGEGDSVAAYRLGSAAGVRHWLAAAAAAANQGEQHHAASA
jgi:trehalose 6-phosphate phosphatase